MSKKNPPLKPTNLRVYECSVVIKTQYFTKLEISPDYEEKNKEFTEGLVEKEIKLTKSELSKVLITDDLIRELIQQLGKKKVIFEGRYYQYTYYSAEPVFNK